MLATADFRLRPQRDVHYNHMTFTPIAKNFMLYCRLIYMLSILCVRLTIKVNVGIPDSFKVGWYPPKKTGSSHLNSSLKSCYNNTYQNSVVINSSINIAGICTSPPPPAETTPIGETLSSTVISWTCNQNSVTFSNKTGTSCQGRGEGEPSFTSAKHSRI